MQTLGIYDQSMVREEYKLATYWLHHLECISHTHQPADVTIANVHSICARCDAEENYEETITPTINDKDWPRTMDGFTEYKE